MHHLSEEQLILHHYGEDTEPEAERHLAECRDCRASYGSLRRLLEIVDAVPVPEPGPEYGSEVWRSIEREIAAERRARWPLTAPWRWAAAVAAMVVVVLFAVRQFSPQSQPQPMPVAGADRQARERVLLVAVGDYLERSQMVLAELSNASTEGQLDITAEQERAEDLLTENRLYRQTASQTGYVAVSSVLEELERVLLDIAHAPSEISAEDLDRLRQRFEAEGILFRIRVLGSNVRNLDEPKTRQEL